MPHPPFVLCLLALCPAMLCAPAQAQNAGPNLLPNASFESGPTGGVQEPYRGGGWRVSSGTAGPPPLSASTEAVEVRGYRDTQTPAAVGVASLRVALLPGRSVQISSPPARLQAGHPYVVSIYLRADVPGTQVTVSLAGKRKTFAVTPVWEEYTFALTATRTESTRVEIETANAASDARSNMLWVDGAQLSEGTQPAAYRPAYPYELRAVCDRPGHVFFDGEKMTLDTLLASGAPPTFTPPGSTLQPPPKPPSGILRVSLRTLSGGTSKTFSQDVVLDDVAQTVRVSLPDIDGRKPRGLFKSTLELMASDGHTPLAAPAECVYARLPRPRVIDPARSSFGVNIPLLPSFAQIALATGNRWAGAGDAAHAFSWPAVEPAPNRLQVFESGTEPVRNSGLAILGTLGGPPPWLGVGSRNSMANKDAWRRYVETVLDRYKTEVNAWDVTPARPQIPGVPYGELLQIASEEARNTDASALVIGTNTGDKTPEAGGVVSIRQDLTDNLLAPLQPPNRAAWNVDSQIKVVSFYTDDANTAQIQAARIVQWDTVQRASGIQKCFLTAADNGGERETGLVEYDRAVSAALAARAVLASLTDGVAAPTKDDTQSGIAAYVFPVQNRGALPNEKTHVTLLWSRDTAVHLVPLPRGAQALDLWGNPLSARGTLTVGTAPVYLLTP